MITLVISSVTTYITMFRYLVHYEGQNKLVEVQDKSELKLKCIEAFGCNDSDITMDVYVRELDENAEIPSYIDLSDTGKIRLRGPALVEDISVASMSTDKVAVTCELENENVR